MNEEKTGKCLRQVEHTRGHLWHIYSITINQVMVATANFRSDDFNLTKRNPWFSRICCDMYDTCYHGEMNNILSSIMDKSET